MAIEPRIHGGVSRTIWLDDAYTIESIGNAIETLIEGAQGPGYLLVCLPVVTEYHESRLDLEIMRKDNLDTIHVRYVTNNTQQILVPVALLPRDMHPFVISWSEDPEKKATAEKLDPFMQALKTLGGSFVSGGGGGGGSQGGKTP